MKRRPLRENTPHVAATAVDLFCGAGGLTHGLLDAGINVSAGYDIDPDCKYAYEHNNPGAKFIEQSVADLTGAALEAHYPAGHIRILVDCAPCQPFSKYAQGDRGKKDDKWKLLDAFARLVFELKPDIVSMENVPELASHPIFDDFLAILSSEDYRFDEEPEKRIVYCPDYGMAQHRHRLVVVASRLGPISLVPPTHQPKEYTTVRNVLSGLPTLAAGEVHADDPLHRSSRLADINLRRIRHSTPGGTWRDWPRKLVAKCHRKKTGKTYPGVYGRMMWDEPAPTVTTQFFGFGNGRFGHPQQDRAISLREGAILQSFPKTYQFVEPGARYSFKTVGRMIGNAVPVRLGEVVGKTINHHLEAYYA
jgi:DNA (cytosine-5)-methyltransferase 1